MNINDITIDVDNLIGVIAFFAAMLVGAVLMIVGSIKKRIKA